MSPYGTSKMLWTSELAFSRVRKYFANENTFHLGIWTLAMKVIESKSTFHLWSLDSMKVIKSKSTFHFLFFAQYTVGWELQIKQDRV